MWKEEMKSIKKHKKQLIKLVIKSIFKMLYKEDLVDKEEYDRLLEYTDKKFEDDNLLK